MLRQGLQQGFGAVPRECGSWQLTPGTSSIQPIHHPSACFTTAVYSTSLPLIVYGVAAPTTTFLIMSLNASSTLALKSD